SHCRSRWAPTVCPWRSSSSTRARARAEPDSSSKPPPGAKTSSAALTVRAFGANNLMATHDASGDMAPPLLTTTTDPEALRDMFHDLEAQAASQPDVVAKARESLEETFQTLQLTPEEERALAGELQQLRALTEKLDQNTIEIAAFGMVSRGKSSVLNALLGQEVFKVGTTHGTTVQRSQERWEQATVDRPGLEGAKLVLVDTPGIDEVGGEVRETLAGYLARPPYLFL